MCVLLCTKNHLLCEHDEGKVAPGYFRVRGPRTRVVSTLDTLESGKAGTSPEKGGSVYGSDAAFDRYLIRLIVKYGTSFEYEGFPF